MLAYCSTFFMFFMYIALCHDEAVVLAQTADLLFSNYTQNQTVFRTPEWSYVCFDSRDLLSTPDLETRIVIYPDCTHVAYSGSYTNKRACRYILYVCSRTLFITPASPDHL